MKRTQCFNTSYYADKSYIGEGCIFVSKPHIWPGWICILKRWSP